MLRATLTTCGGDVEGIYQRRCRFELGAAYVSVLFMSWQPRRGGAGVAPSPLPASARVLAAIKTSFESSVENPTIEHETRTDEAVDLPWQVVVHNDPVNLMSYVTMVFQKIFGFPREKAERHMLEVHQKGRSIVWNGARERGELYVQQLHGYLLLATIERVG
jgi:ATP-dependent Clp protease adaptor protein ClpS